MPRFTVHLYREMRLLFEGINAATHEEAAAQARDRLTDDADAIDDCDGEIFAALVDVVGDEQYEQSRMIDFENERLRKAAPLLLEVMRDLLGERPAVQGGVCQHCGRDYLGDFLEGDCPSDDCPSYKARAAIAQASAPARVSTYQLDD